MKILKNFLKQLGLIIKPENTKPVYSKEITDMAYELYGNHSCPNDLIELAKLTSEELSQLRIWCNEDIPVEYFNQKYRYLIDRFL